MWLHKPIAYFLHHVEVIELHYIKPKWASDGERHLHCKKKVLRKKAWPRPWLWKCGLKIGLEYHTTLVNGAFLNRLLLLNRLAYLCWDLFYSNDTMEKGRPSVWTEIGCMPKAKAIKRDWDTQHCVCVCIFMPLHPLYLYSSTPAQCAFLRNKWMNH